VSVRRFKTNPLFSALATIGCLAAMAVEVVAQAPREVLIGVSRPGAPAVDPAQLYDSASALLRGGNVASAQRQFEQLVARYPDSEAAARARQDLAAIYAPLKLASTPLVTNEMSRLGAPESVLQPAPAGGWRTSVRPAVGFKRTAQEILRDAAGDLVFFSESSVELGARARKALAAQAEWLKQNPALPVVIEGHADDAGTPAELKVLSAARAAAVRDRLIEEGVAPERIRTQPFGADRRVALCADLSCASQNRRALTIVGGRTQAQLQ
jgi:outer membrane protein OmpA-like peptidoglycan-associated protein